MKYHNMELSSFFSVINYKCLVLLKHKPGVEQTEGKVKVSVN